MAVKLARSPTKGLAMHLVTNRWGQALLVLLTLSVSTLVGTFTFFYVKYSHIIEEKLRKGPFANTSMLYAAPQPVMLGDPATICRSWFPICTMRATPKANSNRLGWYHVRPDAVEINPGAGRLRCRRRGDQDRATAKSRRSFRCAITPSAPSITWSRSSSPTCSTRSARSAAWCTSTTFPR